VVHLWFPYFWNYGRLCDKRLSCMPICGPQTSSHQSNALSREHEMWLLGFLLGAHPLQALALVTSPRLGLQQWAYGNHYWVKGEVSDFHMTYDSGIACIFIQGSRSSTRDRNVITTNLYYVGVLKEILVVSYATMKCILLHASWIPSNLCGV